MPVVTWQHIEAIFASPLSQHEKPGELYLHEHLDESSPTAIAAGSKHLKVGRTNDLERRASEWDHQCAPVKHEWIWAYETDTPRRLGEFLLFLGLSLCFGGADDLQSGSSTSR